MDKHEIISLFSTKSDRIKLQKDPKYEAKFPHQCQYVLVDGIKTKFYKCDICLLAKSLITCGARNLKDSIEKHHNSNHEKLFTATTGKRQSEEVGPVNQKKLKTSNSKFQISHVDKTARDDLGRKSPYGRHPMIYHIMLSIVQNLAKF